LKQAVHVADVCAVDVRLNWVSYLTNAILKNCIDTQDRNQVFHYGNSLLLLAFSQWVELVGIYLPAITLIRQDLYAALL